MKTPLKHAHGQSAAPRFAPGLFCVRFAVLLVFGTTALSAQSCAAAGHVSNSAALSVAASGEALSAAGDSAKASLKVVSGVVAVPVMLSGAAIGGSGAVVASAGAAIKGDGEKMWDFATGDPAKRPTPNREKSVPPLKAAPVKAADPSPAEALKSKA